MVPSLRITPEALLSAVRAALVAEGLSDGVATVEAEVMTEADLHGVPSHGVAMLPRLVRGLREGRCTKAPHLQLVRDRLATCVLDGDNGPGRFVAVTAMGHAVERARGFGIGACLARRTTHWGRAHAYALRAAEARCIGICTTNAIPTLAIPGQARASFGNNPIAIGVPRGAGLDPIVLDLAMTQAAFGKVATYAREGREIPPDWGADADGRATRDAAAILASGLLLPMGGHKGVGLALMMEILTAALAGGLFGHEIVAADSSALDPRASKLFLAIDPGAFGDPAAFDARVAALVDYLHGTNPSDPPLFPGERGWRTRREYERDGIPLHPAIVAQLEAVGVRLRTDASAAT